MAYEFMSSIVLAALMHTCLAAGLECENLPFATNPSDCCPIPDIITKKNMEKCKKFLIEPQTSFIPMANENPSAKARRLSKTPAGHSNQYRLINDRSFAHYCFINCALDDTRILANGNLNKTALSTHLKNVTTEMPDWMPVLGDSFKICYEKAENFNANLKNNTSSNATANTLKYRIPPCSPCHLIACVFLENFINCPTSVRSNTKECNDLRNHMRICMPKYSI